MFPVPSGDALNSYHLWRDDMRLAAELGFTGYRFGVEWARIEPAPGCYSRAELARYRDPELGAQRRHRHRLALTGDHHRQTRLHRNNLPDHDHKPQS